MMAKHEGTAPLCQRYRKELERVLRRLSPKKKEDKQTPQIGKPKKVSRFS